jgi:hypothetical protein
MRDQVEGVWSHAGAPVTQAAATENGEPKKPTGKKKAGPAKKAKAKKRR